MTNEKLEDEVPSELQNMEENGNTVTAITISKDKNENPEATEKKEAPVGAPHPKLMKLQYESFKRYLSIDTPAGFESDGQGYYLRRCRKYFPDAEIWKDFMQNGYVKIPCGLENAPTVVLEAHVDEISWRVETKKDNYIFVVENGGVDSAVAPGKRVKILSSSGKVVQGVFGKTAPHLTGGDSAKKSPYETKDLFIDTGLEKEVLESMHILPGDPVVYDDTPYELGEHIVSKGLDNKLGGFIFQEAVRSYITNITEKRITHNYDLIIINSVQEEIGKRGATIALEKIRPDLAIVFDVGHDTSTPGAVGKGGGFFKAGKGPMIVLSPVLQRKFSELFIKSVTDLDKIPFTLRPRGKITGTDADIFSEICPTVLMQVPLKYMHSSIEMVHKKDIKTSIKIVANFLEKLTEVDIREVGGDTIF